jgi:uncharacterized protein YndB with AHSA1/START domain
MAKKQKILKRFILIEKPVNEVWRSCTESPHLTQWLCDEAEVDLREGGRFEFHGPTVVRGGGGQEVLEVRPEQRLSFSWKMGEVQTEVTWLFRSVMDMTRIEVHHTNSEISIWVLDDMWKYYLTMLKFYLEYGSTPTRIDFTKVPDRGIELVMSMLKDSKDVFDAVTVSKHVSNWMEVNADIDLNIGGKYENDWWKGYTITELEPGKKITFTDQEGASISWIVEKAGSKTRLRLVHAGFEVTAFDIENLFYGWSAFMVTIAMYLAKLQPTVTWGEMITE